MAMAAKAKMLLRELKTVRGDLTFLRDRCSQLEEENRRLRESVVKGTRPDEDDLVIFTVSLTFFCCSTYSGTITLWDSRMKKAPGLNLVLLYSELLPRSSMNLGLMTTSDLCNVYASSQICSYYCKVPLICSQTDHTQI